MAADIPYTLFIFLTMKRTHIITLVILLSLTILTAICAGFNQLLFLILALSAIKLLLVAFQFMELKKAHNFWKVFLTLILVIIILIIITVKIL